MVEILIPALSIGAIGLVLGALLAVAAKIFAVKVDERVTQIEDILPKANCGGCGFSGCSAYANAIVNANAPIDCCSACGAEGTKKIAEIMGLNAGEYVKQRAVVLCNGTKDNARDKYEYQGIEDCVMANMLPGGGQKACSYGCMGYGSCVKVCNFGAIKIENGIAVIDENKCSACGACINVCPKHIINKIPAKNKIVVKCKSCDKGAAMKDLCIAGCIGCKLCEKACEFDAIHVKNNIAEIDYTKCTQCGKCVEKCPKKVISEIG